jgi:hypothetical protein
MPPESSVPYRRDTAHFRQATGRPPPGSACASEGRPGRNPLCGPRGMRSSPGRVLPPHPAWAAMRRAASGRARRERRPDSIAVARALRAHRRPNRRPASAHRTDPRRRPRARGPAGSVRVRPENPPRPEPLLETHRGLKLAPNSEPRSGFDSCDLRLPTASRQDTVVGTHTGPFRACRAPASPQQRRSGCRLSAGRWVRYGYACGCRGWRSLAQRSPPFGCASPARPGGPSLLPRSRPGRAVVRPRGRVDAVPVLRCAGRAAQTELWWCTNPLEESAQLPRRAG